MNLICISGKHFVLYYQTVMGKGRAHFMHTWTYNSKGNRASNARSPDNNAISQSFKDKPAQSRSITRESPGINLIINMATGYRLQVQDRTKSGITMPASNVGAFLHANLVTCHPSNLTWHECFCLLYISWKIIREWYQLSFEYIREMQYRVADIGMEIFQLM